MKREIKIAPFSGAITAVDPRLLGNHVAADTRNVRFQDGRLAPRYGFRTFASAPTGYTSTLGFDFLRGYDADRALVEEYLSFENRLGTITPISIHPTTGVRSTITHNGSTMSLQTGVWHSTPFDSTSFSWAQGGSAYVHNLGDYDHFRPVDTTDVPNPPSGTMFVAFGNTITTEPSGDPDGSIAYTGAGSGTLSVWTNAETGSALTKTFKSATSSSMTWDLAVPVDNQDTQVLFRIDLSTLSAGNANLSGISKLRLRWTHAQAAASLKFTGVHHFSFISSGGSALDIGGYWTHNEVENKDGSGNLVSRDSYFDLRFPPSTPASSLALLASTRYIEGQVSIYATAVTSARSDIVWHMPRTWGGAPAEIPNTNNGGSATFGYAFYKSGWEIESELIKESTEYYMDIPSQFYEEEGLGAEYFGNSITLLPDDPADTGDEDIDQIAYYFKSDDGIWRLISVEDYAASGYTVPYSYLELLENDRRNWQAYRPIGAIKWAVGYGGAMAWLKAGSRDNIEISAVGEPKQLWNAAQTSSERGVQMSMSPAFDDEPIWAGTAGEAFVLLGSRGAYASVGLIPQKMTPSKRLPGSKGVIGARAATRWKDDGGNPGIAYLGIDQEIWFAAVTPGFNGELGFRLDELSRPIRGLVRSFLTQTDSPTTSALSLVVDELSDSLWLTYEDRALVLRKASIIDGQRYWEQYDYSTSWPLLAEDSTYGLRVQTASGRVDELERNSANNYAAITGSGLDAGTPVTNIYWKSKVFTDVRRRVRNLRVERSTLTDQVSATFITDRQTESVVVASNRKNANVGYKSQGENWQLQINMAETDAALVMATIEEFLPISTKRDG